MLSKKMAKALNEQVGVEHAASSLYLAMASWCDTSGLPGSAKFFYGHAEQERLHMLKLFHYVNDTGGHALVPATASSPTAFKGLAEVFEATLKHEIEVSKKINALVDACLADRDHSTFNFLQWYVAEQHEEELLFTHIVQKARLIGPEGRGIFWLDHEIGKMADKDPA